MKHGSLAILLAFGMQLSPGVQGNTWLAVEPMPTARESVAACSVDGKIYANVWQKESMMIIDAGSGAIEGVVNFGGLSKQVTQHRDLDVFNGVAYHPGRNTFFVTGKNWDKLFEVRIVKRD